MVKRKRLLVSAHFIMDCLPPAELMFSAVDDGNNLRFLPVFDQGNAFVGINGSAAVMASFPEELSINNLLGMNGKKGLLLSPNFPIFRFGDSKMDYENSEKTFRNFYIDTAYEFFNPENAIRLLAAMTSPCDRLKIWLPTAENMYYLMYSLHDIRKLKFKDFKIPARTVLSHFQRNRLITRFTDLCEYERLFNSGGLYLLSELMYLNEKRGFGIISGN